MEKDDRELGRSVWTESRMKKDDRELGRSVGRKVRSENGGEELGWNLGNVGWITRESVYIFAEKIMIGQL